jgi:hypothetical protein
VILLIEWEVKPKYREDVLKAWKNYKQHEAVKTILPVHNCVGSTRGVAVVETNSTEGLEATLRPFLDYVNFVVTPLLEFKRPE